MRQHVLAVDPGLKPGVAEFEVDEKVVRLVGVRHKLDGLARGLPPWDLVVTEEQWMFHSSKVNPNSLFKLAFRAGFTLASIPAVRRMALPPRVWRGESKLTKEQMQRQIADQLTTEERKLFAGIPASRHGDVLDAIGIGKAALRIAPTTKKYDWTI